MADFKNFQNELLERVRKELDERKVEGLSLKLETIDSPDGVTDRLIVSVSGLRTSMAIRLEEPYQNIKDGESIDSIVTRMANTIEENLIHLKSMNHDVGNFLSNYEKVKDYTYLRMLPGDSPVLKNTPHKMIMDMACVVSIHLDRFSDGNGRSVAIIDQKLMETYGIDEAELFADARNNTLEHEPLKLEPLGDILSSINPFDEYPEPDVNTPRVYIATNESGFHGASIISYPDFLDRAEEKIGISYWIIPSSVHEFILVEDDGRHPAEYFDRTIRDINERCLKPQDVLSDHCYHYDGIEHVLETGLEYESRTLFISEDNDIDDGLEL